MAVSDSGDLTLPRPTGPHPVGFSDVEFESPCGRMVLCRLHYPLTTDQNYTQSNRGMWLPSEEYHPGYGYYLRIPSWLSGTLFRYIAGHVQTWAIRDPPSDTVVEPRGSVIFSHGLGGIRTTYSSLCCDWASHGWLVAAIEHRDGTAAITVDHEGRPVPYLLPHENNEYNFRSMQLGQRVEECRAVKEFIMGNYTRVISGKHLVVKKNEFYGVGHSMGAATVIKGADMFKSIVALDPWSFPLPANLPPLHTPCLIISLEHFSWPDNSLRLLDLLSRQPPSRYLMIRNADHADQSDVPAVMPEVIRWRMRTKGTVEPGLVIRMTAELVREFVEGRGVKEVEEFIQVIY